MCLGLISVAITAANAVADTESETAVTVAVTETQAVRYGVRLHRHWHSDRHFHPLDNWDGNGVRHWHRNRSIHMHWVWLRHCHLLNDGVGSGNRHIDSHRDWHWSVHWIGTVDRVWLGYGNGHSLDNRHRDWSVDMDYSLTNNWNGHLDVTDNGNGMGNSNTLHNRERLGHWHRDGSVDRYVNSACGLYVANVGANRQSMTKIIAKRYSVSQTQTMAETAAVTSAVTAATVGYR